ncbi:MAG: type II toxin-antitoxin system RatA family toxin [Burkholderiaceae bacterium]
MASIEKSVLVRHGAAAMFALVADIPSYPQFLPWCSGARVVSREVDSVTAEVDINFHGIRQSFTTINTQRPYDLIELRLVKGPFSALDGHWRFMTLADDACKVELGLNYDFNNFLLQKLVGPVFHQIATTMVDSFVKRADDVAASRTDQRAVTDGPS